MKKTIIILLVIAMLFSFVAAAPEREIKVTIDGKEVLFPDQKPIAENQRTLVPVRFVSEALGANVDWIQQEQKVKIEKDGQLIELILGQKKVKVGDKTIELDVATKAYNQRTLVPLRFISEALGCDVEWVQETYTVVITTGAGIVENDLVNVPLKSEAIVELYGKQDEDNPHNVDFSILILLYKPYELQYEDAQKLLEARFGKNNEKVKEIMSYVIQGKEKMDIVDTLDNFDEWLKAVNELKSMTKYWTINNQSVSVGFSPGFKCIDILVWRDVK